ncbi:MAG: NRDE family protein [Gammaproteobacteria bacterium]|nr:NRDE family protein [Gammaproteobacteria bacterium]
MCLIVLALAQHPEYPLILLANRDEYYARPTAPLAWWQDHAQILAGRDLQAGGSWLGINRNGYIAALTNFREAPPLPGIHSRGKIVSDYLRNIDDANNIPDFINAIKRSAYAGFNALYGNTAGEMYYFSNRSKEAYQKLTPGVYGLSNHLLDTDWPKVRSIKQLLAQELQGTTLDESALLNLMRDTTLANADELPATGVSWIQEKMLSPIFIKTADYGTRSTSLLTINKAGHINFTEIEYSSLTLNSDVITRHAFDFTV